MKERSFHNISLIIKVWSETQDSNQVINTQEVILSLEFSSFKCFFLKKRILLLSNWMRTGRKKIVQYVFACAICNKLLRHARIGLCFIYLCIMKMQISYCLLQFRPRRVEFWNLFIIIRSPLFNLCKQLTMMVK